MAHTLLRPHWRPTHDASPQYYDRWIAPDGRNAYVKILNPDAEHCRNVWKVAPETILVLRNHGISEQKSEMRADPVGLARRHVDFWEQWVTEQGLKDRLGQLVFEGLNEVAIWEGDNLPKSVQYWREFVIDSARNPQMVVGVLNMNTGWPTNYGIPDGPPDWAPFDPLYEVLVEYGGYAMLHEYWDIRGPSSDDWGWNPGRFTQLPDKWKQIPILITECGYDEAVNAPEGTPNHGWQGKVSHDDYMRHLKNYDFMVRDACAQEGWDVRACFIFTDDFDPPWGSFDTRPLRPDLAFHAESIRLEPDTEPEEEATDIYLPSVSRNTINMPEDERWQLSIAFLLAEEGGFQDHEADNGNWTGGKRGVGELKGTNFGISAASFPNLDIRAITVETAKAIYRQHYWFPSGAATLPWPLCLLVFDTAVLHGVGTSTQWAQESGSAAEYLAKRLGSYTRMSNWNIFGAGWTNRVARLLQAMGDSL